MKMAWIAGLAAVAMATVGPAAAYQNRDTGTERAAQSRNDGVIDGRCYSRASHRWDAEAFCGQKLRCESGRKLKCKGATSRYVCVCQ